MWMFAWTITLTRTMDCENRMWEWKKTKRRRRVTTKTSSDGTMSISMDMMMVDECGKENQIDHFGRHDNGNAQQRQWWDADVLQLVARSWRGKSGGRRRYDMRSRVREGGDEREQTD